MSSVTTKTVITGIQQIYLAGDENTTIEDFTNWATAHMFILEDQSIIKSHRDLQWNVLDEDFGIVVDIQHNNGHWEHIYVPWEDDGNYNKPEDLTVAYDRAMRGI